MTRIRDLGAMWKWVLLVVLVLGCSTKKKSDPCANPNYVQAMKDQAVSYFQGGQYIEALKSAKQAEACKPKDPELYYWLGRIYFQRDKFYDAIENYQRSIDIDPAYVESHMALGVVYLELERWDEAISEFEAAARDELFVRPWEAYNNMGWAYLQKGEYALAEVNFQRALRANDKFCFAYCNRGELYSRQGHRRKAMDNYIKAIKLCPNNYARPHFLLAREYGRQGSYFQACKEFYAASKMERAPEAEKAREYMRLYNCSSVLASPQSR